MAQVLLKSSSFLAIMLLGALLRRFRFFGAGDYRIVMKLVLNITLPAAVITGFASYRPEPALLLCTVMGFAFNWATLLLAALCSRGKHRSIRAVWLNSVPGYCIGAFALPFVQSFLPPAGVVSCCLFDAGSALMCSGGTYAVSQVILSKDGKVGLGHMGRSLLSSRPFLTYVVMLILSLAGIMIPKPVVDFLSPIASANTFLSMMMVGMMFDTQLDRAALKNAAGMVLMRVCAAAAAACGCLLLPLPMEVRQALAIAVCAPVSFTSTALSERAGGDPALAACVSSLTIPISVTVIIALLTLFGTL